MKDIAFIRSSHTITFKDGSMCLKKVQTGEKEYILPEEISVLIIENQFVTIQTAAVMNLLQSNVTILFCDSKHQPTAIISNDYGYVRKLEVLRLQMDLNKKTKGRIWQKIVRQKIENQRNVLAFGGEGISADILANFDVLIKEVNEGDTSAREAVAARKYFSLCFGTGFVRGRYPDKINAALNYGYAIIRAVIRKRLVARGFEPALGINHASSENPFNLSDDIIEPYRPFIDGFVLAHIKNNGEGEFREVDRIQLIEEILLTKCIINEKVFSLHDAVDVTIESLKQCYEKNSSSGLKLPKMIEL